MSRTLLYQRLGNLVLVVQSAQNPSDEDWAGYLDVFRKDWQGHHECHILVLSAGGSPNNLQQRQVNELVPGLAVKVAVVPLAESVHKIVRRLLIVNDAMRLYRLNELEKALDFLDVPFAERAAVEVSLLAMRAQLGL